MQKATILKIDYTPTSAGNLAATCEGFPPLNVIGRGRVDTPVIVVRTLERIHELAGTPVRVFEVENEPNAACQTFVMVPAGTEAA